MATRPQFMNPFAQRRSPINKASQNIADLLTQVYQVNRQQAGQERLIDALQQGDREAALEAAPQAGVNPFQIYKQFTAEDQAQSQQQQRLTRAQQYNRELAESIQTFEQQSDKTIDEIGLNPPLLDPEMSPSQMNKIVQSFTEKLNEARNEDVDLSSYNRDLLNLYNRQFNLNLSDEDINKYSDAIAETPGLMDDILGDLTQQRDTVERSDYPGALDDVRQLIQDGAPVTRNQIRSIARGRQLREDDIKELTQYAVNLRTQNQAKLRRQFHKFLLSDEGLPRLVRPIGSSESLSEERKSELAEEIQKSAGLYFGGMLGTEAVQSIVDKEMESFGIDSENLPQIEDQKSLDELYKEMFGEE